MPASIAHRIVFATLMVVSPLLAQAEPMAWISNQGSNSLSVIDTATDTLSGGPITLPPLPHAVAVSATRVYVTHGNGILSIIDKATRMVSTKSFPSNTLAGVAVGPDGSRVYASGYGTDQLFVIDTTTNNAVATLPISDPIGIAVKPDGSRAYIAYDDGFTARIAVLDTTSNTLLPPIGLAGREATGIAVSPDGTRLYVTLGATDRVAIVHLDTNAVSYLDTGGEPRGIVVNHAGTRAYFTKYTTNQVGVIDTATGAVIDHFFPGGSGPWGIDVSADDSRVYVANHDSSNVGIHNVVSHTTVTRSVGSLPVAFGRFIDTYVPPQLPPVLGDVPNQNGTAGVAFSLDLANYVTTTNGDPILSYDIVAGALPVGLDLDTVTGLINGTPALAGRGASITVNVSDDDGASTSDTIAFTIAPPAGAAPFDVMVSSYNASVRGFSQALNGNVAPSRMLTGATTQLMHPLAMAYEPTTGELYVGDSDYSGNNAVRVFAANADGNVAPTRVLDTRFDRRPNALAVDLLHDELVVVGSGCWPCTWPRTAIGAATTLRSLAWGGNSPTQGNNPVSVALDPDNDLMFIGDNDFSNSPTPNLGKVLVFPRTANGGVAPSRVIKGATARIGIGAPYLAFDPVTRQLFVLTNDIDPGNIGIRHARILAFHADADGDVAPLRAIEGAATQLDIPSIDAPYGLSFDSMTQRLLVSIYSNSNAGNRVLAFYAGDNGNVAPLISIGGASTGFDRIGHAAVVPVKLLFRNGFE